MYLWSILLAFAGIWALIKTSRQVVFVYKANQGRPPINFWIVALLLGLYTAEASFFYFAWTMWPK